MLRLHTFGSYFSKIYVSRVRNIDMQSFNRLINIVDLKMCWQSYYFIASPQLHTTFTLLFFLRRRWCCSWISSKSFATFSSCWRRRTIAVSVSVVEWSIETNDVLQKKKNRTQYVQWKEVKKEEVNFKKNGLKPHIFFALSDYPPTFDPSIFFIQKQFFLFLSVMELRLPILFRYSFSG